MFQAGLVMRFFNESSLKRILSSINLKTLLSERIYAKKSITRAPVEFSWHTFHLSISRIIFDLTFTRSSFRLTICSHWSDISVLDKLCDFDWYR